MRRAHLNTDAKLGNRPVPSILQKANSKPSPCSCIIALSVHAIGLISGLSPRRRHVQSFRMYMDRQWDTTHPYRSVVWISIWLFSAFVPGTKEILSHTRSVCSESLHRDSTTCSAGKASGANPRHSVRATRFLERYSRTMPCPTQRRSETLHRAPCRRSKSRKAAYL